MSQASEQTARLARSVRDVSRQLQGVSQGGAPPQGIVADNADQAAGVTSRLADPPENPPPAELLHDVRRSARQSPDRFPADALGSSLACCVPPRNAANSTLAGGLTQRTTP